MQQLGVAQSAVSVTRLVSEEVAGQVVQTATLWWFSTVNVGDDALACARKDDVSQFQGVESLMIGNLLSCGIK